MTIKRSRDWNVILHIDILSPHQSSEKRFLQIAASVVNEAFSLNLAQIKKPDEELISYIKKRMWDPEHPTKFESRL